MIVYLSLLAGSVLLGIPMCRNKAGRLIYCIIMGIALFLAAALRRGTGHDYNSYANMYIEWMKLSPAELTEIRTEKGFVMITKLLSEYFASYQPIFVFCAAFFAAAVTLLVYKRCTLPWLGFACFLTFGVYFNSLNFLRQMTAGFIVAFALKYIEENRFFRYLILVIFASCFHFSALIMIPFYFILKIRMTPVTLGVYAGITALLMIFSQNILELAADYLYMYKSYIITNVHVTTGVTPIYMIFFAVFFAAAFIFGKRLTADDPSGNILINCMFFTLFFELLGVKHSILSRFGVFFIIPAAVVLMPRLMLAVTEKCREAAKGNDGRRKALCAAAIAVFAALNLSMYGLMLANNYNGVMPYRTVYDVNGTEAGKE